MPLPWKQPPVWCSKAELTARSEALHRFLVGTKPLWEPRPFENPAPPWTHSHRELTAFLDALDDDALSALEADPDACAHPGALAAGPQRRLLWPCPHQCPIHRNRPRPPCLLGKQRKSKPFFAPWKGWGRYRGPRWIGARGRGT